MTDENKKTSDDEYQFPQDEYMAGEQEHDADTSHDYTQPGEDANTGEVQSSRSFKDKMAGILERHPMLQNKRVLGVIVLAVVALIAFKIMSPSSHKVKKVATQTTSAQQQQEEMLASKLARLSHDVSKNQGTVGQLQSQISGLQNALNTSNQNSEAMKDAVIALAQQVENLSQEVNAKKAKPKKHSKYPPPPVITYHLLALESGRAWIMGSNGISDSVRVGTKISKHYGTVKAIHPNTGKVLTSSGKVITYNANGN